MDFLLKPGIKRQEDSMKETFSQKSKLTEHPNFETLLILQQKFIKGNNSSIFWVILCLLWLANSEWNLQKSGCACDGIEHFLLNFGVLINYQILNTW